MNKFKRIALLLVGLILVFSLIGCTADKDEPGNDIVQTPEDEIENQDEDMEEPIEDPVEDDMDEEDIGEDMGDDMDSIDAMIESSNYISKIKVITKGEDNSEIEVLDNIKKEISQESLPVIPELEENKTYLVFMKDEGNTVVLTDETEGVILLEGDNKELFEKINKQVNN